MSDVVPTLSIYPYLPGDVELPYPSGAHLGDSTPSSVVTTLSGAFETIQSSQGDGRTWTLSWDALTLEQYQGLQALAKARAVFFRDPLGRRCLVQVQEFRPSVAQQEFDAQGRQMYAANVDALVLQAGHLPWCPSFTAAAVTTGPLRGYGRFSASDPLGEESLIYTTAPVNGAPACPRHNRAKNGGYTTRRDTHGHWHVYRPDGTELTEPPTAEPAAA